MRPSLRMALPLLLYIAAWFVVICIGSRHFSAEARAEAQAEQKLSPAK